MNTNATTVAPVKFSRAVRNAVCKASDGLPSLGAWVNRIHDVATVHGSEHLMEAIEGIWCGRNGRATIDMPGSRSMLCVGWHNGRVEFSYLS